MSKIYGKMKFYAKVSACLVLAVLIFGLTAAPSSAKENDFFLARMKIVKEVTGGAAPDYEVEIEGKGKALIKAPDVRIRVGEQVNFWVAEILPERGLPAYELCEVKPDPFHEGIAVLKVRNKDRKWGYAYFDKEGESYYSFVFYGDCFYEKSEGILTTTSYSSYYNGISFWVPTADGHINPIGERDFPLGFSENETRRQQAEMGGGYGGFGEEDPKTVFREGHVIAFLWDKNGDRWRCVVIDRDGKYSYLRNRNGEEFSPRQTGAMDKSGVFYPFSDGLALLKVDEGLGSQCLYFDYSGKAVLPPSSEENNYRSANPFREGLAVVSFPKKDLMIIDKSGKEVADLSAYGAAHSYVSEGMLGVKEKPYEGKWAFIDKTGKRVTNYNYEHVFPFSDGLALVEQKTEETMGTRFGYINKSGEIVIPMQYLEARPFSEGLAAVYSDGVGKAWKYIDTNGADVIDKEYIINEGGDFSDGVALILRKGGYEGRVKLPNRYEYLDKQGNVVLWFYTSWQ